MFQMTENGNLVGTMTVRDNIHFRQLLFRSGKGIADGGHTVDSKRLEDEPLVRAFELEGHLDKKVAELSTGLRKRVGIVAGMLFDDYEAFTKASTLGRDRTHVDFGLPARGRQA